MINRAFVAGRPTRALLFICALCLMKVASEAQSPEAVRRAFTNLRTDQIPRNCGDSLSWLLENREALKVQMLEELYRTDTQARDAILMVLFQTDSFVPDERFARFVVARLPEHDKRVSNLSIIGSGQGAHWQAWEFIDKHFDRFAPLLKEQIGRTNDGWTLWCIAWLFEYRGLLKENLSLFTPAVLTKAAANLHSDEVNHNAGWAIRLFFILGDAALPILQETAKSDDVQARSLARAAIDARTKGTRDAFGFLCSKVVLDKVPFGNMPEEPEWIAPLAERFSEIETYP